VVEISTENPRLGNKHLHSKISATADRASAGKVITSRMEYYARAYIYFKTLPNIAETGGALRVFGLYTDGVTSITAPVGVGVRKTAAGLVFSVKSFSAENPANSYNDDIPDVELKAGKWYCVEIYSKRGTGCHTTVWIDGTQVVDRSMNGTDETDLYAPISCVKVGITTITDCTTAFVCETFADAVVVSTEPIGEIPPPPPPPPPPTLAETITTMMNSLISIIMVVLLIRMMLSILKAVGTK
jgi:hypothetical protein